MLILSELFRLFDYYVATRVNLKVIRVIRYFRVMKLTHDSANSDEYIK